MDILPPTPVTRPTPSALAFARSTLPVRRVALTNATGRSGFAALLASTRSTARTTSLPRVLPKLTRVTHAALIPTEGGPAPISGSEILANAQQLLKVPYVWGGNSAKGLDCSSFVSKAWGVGRLTTDNLATVSQAVTKDDLQAGDALNLTTARDPDGNGHVRLFEKWANPEHTKLWVYEETPPQSVHRVISWDAHYQPMRRFNTVAQ
jgi:cell wall-associated NlpC family hydrolase